MDFQNIFPFWEQLNSEEQNMVSASALPQKMKKAKTAVTGVLAGFLNLQFVSVVL